MSTPTPTPCPDEDTYALFLQGILPQERIAEIERHIDLCPRCAELGAQFGKLYGAAAPAAEEPAGDEPRRRQWLLLVELLMTAFHALAALAVLPAALPLAAARDGSTLTAAAAIYAAAWVPLGGAAAALAAWALWRRRTWGAAMARAHAIVSLPSLILTPLAVFVLREARTRRRRPPSLG